MKIDKSYLKSKTLWTALIVALLPIVPEVQVYIKNNPEVVSSVVAGLFAALRLITNKALVIDENK